EDFHVVNEELFLYDPALAEKVLLVAANKMDLPGAERNLERLQSALGGKYEIFPVSAVTGAGIGPLLARIAELLASLPRPEPATETASPEAALKKEPLFSITRREGVYFVEGKALKRMVAMTDLDNPAAVARLQKAFQRLGLEKELVRAGARDGATVQIGSYQFVYRKEE
ncbi:MAG: Obg family GTPase CgtA, partial [Desulfotomaculales bacterium]